jgi:hypothetical protein
MSARLVRISDVRREPLTWLWPGYIPAGKITLLDGDPEAGKSLLTIDLAARLSRGRPMPDGTVVGPPAQTLFVQAEDGDSDTLGPRLDAAGADGGYVHVFEHENRRPVRIPRDLPVMEGLVREQGIRLVVIDPFMAFLSRRVATGIDQSVRWVMGRLTGLAARTGAAVIPIRHLNKESGQKVMYRGGGSIGIIAAARSALLAAADPTAPGRNLLATIKSNLGGHPPALGYRIVPTDAGVGVIEWLGPVGLTAAEALAPIRKKAEEMPELGVILATEWLMGFLRGGPRAAVEVYRAAEEQGISERTLERAKGPAGVESRLIVDKVTGDRQWRWRLFETPSFLPPLPFEEEEEDGW